MPIIRGSVIKDAEARTSSSGKPFYVFTIAESDPSGTGSTTYVSVVAFISPFAALKLKKGAIAEVDAALLATAFVNKQSKLQANLKVIVNRENLSIIQEAAEKPVPPLSLQDYYRALEFHDWYYTYSDDSTVYAQGSETHARLTKIAHQSPQHAILLEGFTKHYFSGEPWGTQRAPKPVCP